MVGALAAAALPITTTLHVNVMFTAHNGGGLRLGTKAALSFIQTMPLAFPGDSEPHGQSDR